MKVRDFDGRLRHEHFTHELDAKEFEFFILRRTERYAAELEIIPENLTFAEWVSRWLERRKKIRPMATWHPEELRLRSTWLPAFGTRRLSSIHSAEIRAKLDALVAAGKSPATRNRHRAMLHRLFEEARREYPPLVAHNPVRPIPTLQESWRTRDRYIFSEEDIAAYLRAAKQLDARWFRTVQLLLCGARISECLAVGNADVSEPTVHVHRIYCKTEKKVVARTKGQRANPNGYHVPLLQDIARGTDELVAGGLPYWKAMRLHKETLHLAELPDCDIRTFRHYVGRKLRLGGFTRDDIRDLLGHADSRTTERYTPTGVQHLAHRARRLSFQKKKPKRRTR